VPSNQNKKKVIFHFDTISDHLVAYKRERERERESGGRGGGRLDEI